VKKAVAENTRAVTSQLGEQAEDALQRLSATHAKLEAVERRLESLGVDAVALQVGACMGYGVARCVDASRSASTPWKWTRIMYLLPLASSLPPLPPTCSPCKLPPRFRCKTRSIATSRQRPHLNCVSILLPLSPHTNSSSKASPNGSSRLMNSKRPLASPSP
jgi:hypothetical protein